MNTTPETTRQPSEERVRAIAYALWEEEGRPDGRADEHWHRAMEIAVAELADPDWLKRQEQPAETRTEPAPVELVAQRKVA